jgi:ubiquinone/menaquinone biosynthesis C-methylase UbiE
LNNSFDRVASIYDASRGLPEFVSEQVTEYILRLVSATPNTTFLEPGVGTGRIALPIVQRGYSYTGIDISEKMMDELRRKFQQMPNNLTLLQADATRLPFENDSFDVVVCVHLLHLIPAWRQALAEIRRVLKPEGVFLYCPGSASCSGYKTFEQQWKAILAQHGFRLARYGAAAQQVVEVLTEEGAILETVTAAEWQNNQTIGEWLYAYQERFFSSSWQIPDEIFSKAIQDLKGWVLRNYKSEETVLSSTGKFELIVARQWKFR